MVLVESLLIDTNAVLCNVVKRVNLLGNASGSEVPVSKRQAWLLAESVAQGHTDHACAGAAFA